jgi:hypothetical protein
MHPKGTFQQFGTDPIYVGVCAYPHINRVGAGGYLVGSFRFTRSGSGSGLSASE